MKLLKKSVFAMSLVGMMGLWSCSSEEALQGGDTTVKGQPVPLTLTISRGDALTRTILSENEIAGLDSKWVEGDKVFVYNTSGIKVGELTIQSGWDTSVGVFSGTITAAEGSRADYAVWYYDTENEKITEVSDNFYGLSVDLTNQNFTSPAELSAMEVLGTGDANDDGGFEIAVKNGVASVTKDVTLESKLAMARFSLQGVGLPEGTKGTLNIYNADGRNESAKATLTKNVYRIIFSTADVGQSLAGPQGITVPNAEAGKDVYVAFAPGAYRLGFTFTTEDGQEYVYEFKSETTLRKGVYYSNGLDAEGNVLGTPLEFKNKDGRDDKKTFLIQYVQNLIDEGGEVTAEDRYNHMTEAEMEFIIKDYATMFTENPLDEKLFTFKHWSRNWNAEEPGFDVGDHYTLRYNDESTAWTYFYEDGSFEPMVWIRLYACWEFHYTLNFELEDDVVVTGVETLNRVEPATTGKHVTLPIIEPDKNITVTRPGYELLGWSEKGTEYFFTNTVTLGQHKVEITLVPVWKELPKTIATPNYGHGSFN